MRDKACFLFYKGERDCNHNTLIELSKKKKILFSSLFLSFNKHVGDGSGEVKQLQQLIGAIHKTAVYLGKLE